MIITFLLGVAYGVGGTAFGLAIKHIGYSLTYAIAIGISCVLGTLTGPLLSGALGELLDKPGSEWVMIGVFVGAVGTLLCGLAGRLKEVELQAEEGKAQTFALGKGLTLCLIAGVLSAIYGIAINDTGRPIADVAAEFGAGHWQTNVVYIFANTGAFVTTSIYVLWLGIKQKTLGEFIRANDASPGALPLNYLLAILTGCLWYSQFLFYGLGHVRMGLFEFSSWALHMIMLILISSLAGIAMREWHGRSRRTRAAILAALCVLVVAVLMLTYGNYLGEVAAAH
jgi:L-rhamnose-H+ transport protein